jgi:hypothetical protein
MKRPRPYIPLAVRVQVAERQLGKEYSEPFPARGRGGALMNFRLQWLLLALGIIDPQLDHDPALILREFNPRTGKYKPDANDPEFLVYREKSDHLHKTTGRKPGAAKTVTTKGSDIWLKSKFDRLEGRTKKRPKVKIPARKNPWPKRKFKG